MSLIHVKVAVGMRLRIRLPIMPDQTMIKGWAKKAEDVLTPIFRAAVKNLNLDASFGPLAKMVTLDVVDARTRVDVESMEP